MAQATLPRPTWFVGPWELSTATAHLPPTPTAGRVLLIESNSKDAALPYHRWKLVLVRSALRHFVAELRAAGYEVDHRVAESYADGIRAHAEEFGPSEVLVQEPAEWGVSESLGLGGSGNGERGTGNGEPGTGNGERGTGKTLTPAHGARFAVPLRSLPDRRFLTSRAEFAAWAKGRKLFRMEDFYRWQRRRLDVLMEPDGEPVGGTWNLDTENRQTAKALQKALVKSGGAPAPRGFAPDEMTRQVMRLVERMGVGRAAATDDGEQGTGNGERGTGNRESGTGNGEPGTGNRERGTGNGERGTGNGEQGTGNGEQGTGNGERDSGNGHWGSVDGFDLPVTRAQALAALDDFLEHRLAGFGPYEDAMLAGERYLYHSRLSAAMNVGLLHPREMIAAAVGAWKNGERGTGNRTRSPFPVPRSPIPLSSLEGFVRQIIGWREYVNGIYWQQMPAYREVNYFGFTRPLPQLFWEPERTELACVKDVVTSVRDTAYAHHIPRLMILCNFAVLTGVHPLRLSEWFWAGFADAMEWVELPNVVGMGTFGDGGLLGSKPYVSSAAYINRMSNYCGGCRYDPKQRTGPDACPFNYLYWTFLDDVRGGGGVGDGQGGTGNGERGMGPKLNLGQRMALVLKQLEKIPVAELRAMRGERERFLAGLEADSTGWSFHHDQG